MRNHRRQAAATAACALLAAVGVGATTIGGAATASAKTASVKAHAADTTIKTLEFVNPLPSIPTWQGISNCISEQAKADGITYTETGPPASDPADPTTMIQEIQQAVSAGQNAIITFPASAAFDPVLQQAQKAGVITATLYGTGLPSSGATVNAGVNWTIIGKQYVQAIAARPGQHLVGLVAEAPTGVGLSWVNGVKAAAKKTKNVKIVQTVYIGADASQALPKVSAMLTAHKKIDIVASNTGLMTSGAVAAIKQLGLKGKVHLLVINNAEGGPQAVRSGYAIGVFLQDLCTLGKDTVTGLIQASHGKKVPLVQVHDVIATKSNLTHYIKLGWN
jgi:ABC-type sugar transport system substrate-binding protein